MKKTKAILSVALIMMISCSKGQKNQEKPAPKVGVTKAISKTIPLLVEGIGHVRAFNSAEIKAQVEGTLLQIHFEEGDEVQEGQLLYTIDPRPFIAKRDQVLAERASNIAKLSYAAERVARYKPLLPENFVSVLELINFQSDMEFYEAEIMKNEADLQLAEINLDYCFIKAPFTGVTGKRLIDVGNLIANDGKPLIILNQMDPIYIDFSVPEKNIMRLLMFQHQGNLNVEIAFPELPDKTFNAKLILVDNMIAKNTGMIPLRAQVDNPERLFWPGQFVSAKVTLTQIKNAILVPQIAINFNMDGPFIYVVNDKNEAEMRSVSLGEKIDDLVEVISGVKAGEMVITSGQIRVLPGKKVELKGDK